MSGGGSTNYSFLDPGSASNTLAQLVQQQQANYQAMYEPVENQLIDYATNPNTISNAQARAGANASIASAGAAQGLNKTLEGQGIKLTPVQEQAQQRKLGLQASLSKVGAMNTAGQQTYDTISQVLSGGAAPNIAALGGLNTATPNTGVT